jgi:hypothetical protein
VRHPGWSHDGTQVICAKLRRRIAEPGWHPSRWSSKPFFPTPQGYFTDDPVFTADGRGIFDSNRAGTTNLDGVFGRQPCESRLARPDST